MSANLISTEKRMENHLKSPFQLTREKPLKIISLPQTLAPTTARNGTSSTNISPASSTASMTSDTSDSLSPKGLIGANPFSLQLKKIGNLSTSSSLATSPTSVLVTTAMGKEGITKDQRIMELQNELTSLHKDMEAKDAKLSSSVKSIKQFWSPELKKERAARRDESERCLLLKEKYQISNTQIEEYKKTLEDLESELNSQEQQINILNKELKKSSSQKNVVIKLENEIDSLKQDDIKKGDEIFVLNRTLEDFEIKYKQLEDDCFEKNKCISDLEIILVEQERREKEYEASTGDIELICKTLGQREHELEKLEEEYFNCKKNLDSLQKKYDKQQKSTDELATTLREKDRRISAYRKDVTKFENESSDLKTHYKEVEEKISSKEEQKSALENVIETLKAKVEELKTAVDEKEQLYDSTKIDVEHLRIKDEENIERINELEDLFLAKDKEYDKLQLELQTLQQKINEINESVDIEWFKDALQAKDNELNAANKKALTMRGKLQDAEKLTKDYEKELKKLKINNATSELEETLTQKEKEIADLEVKYNKLDKYLSERENALENCREELKDLKVQNSNFNMAKEQLENQIYEQKTLLERLEKQKTRFDKPKDTVSITVHKELKAKYEETLRTSESDKVKLKDLAEKLKANEKMVAKLETQCETDGKELFEKMEESKNLTNKNEKLTKEVGELQQKLAEAEKQRLRATSDGRTSSPVKESKNTKHLWDELSKKEAKIEELEKQLKEKARQITNLKKSQMAEKKEQHQIVNEVKKAETAAQIQQLQEEIERKDNRTTVLEAALLESVSIAAEREDILARHVEMSEEAESEYDRIAVEKAITNIKNAFLILSLSERDALIVSMKAARRRNNEELLNIKQEGLLASISEKDTQIAHLELQSSKNKRQEIKQMKAEKERLVNELKEQNKIRMTLLNAEDTKDSMIRTELKDAPPEQVYEAIRHLSNSSNKLEYYIEELMSFLREKNADLVSNVKQMPQKKAKPLEKLKKESKDELMKELRFVEEDSFQLKQYVDNLLDKLEGPLS